MLHERRFRSRLEDKEDSQNCTILLHAIVATTLKHLDPSEIGLELYDVDEQIRTSTDFVLFNGFQSLSVENAQALIMLCFERVGSGDWPKAWSILGSLTRTVDYLQMAVEPSERRYRPLVPPLTLLDEPKDHAELEERKRVFVSILMGQQPTITSANETTIVEQLSAR